jgi:L-fucose/D-arabinose isomerase
MANTKDMKVLQPVNRLQGSLPKVGIRPTIDGRRRGVRESLENQTMAMARSVAALVSRSLRHPCGLPVECVISDACIGGVAEAARSAEQFAREGVGVSITVTPCWCYGAETMDMDPLLPKAVWGFNGTERPGAVYLASVLAGYAQKGLPAFGIYGHDVKDSSDTSIPADVEEKILTFARAGLAAATMRGKSYLAMGGMSMGIAGSIVDPRFLESWLGMRYEMVDSSEFIRRVNEKIYDPDELARALAWVKQNCAEGPDRNERSAQKSRAQKDADWEFVVKMVLIGRDLMVGNPRLAELGFAEEALGHNAIASGFQGQRQWTDFMPNGDFLETILNTSFDWNGIREAFVCATENDYLNGIAMLFGHQLTGTASIFSDVRTYWSPDAVKRVTGKALTGAAAPGVIHLINSGSTTLDGTGRQSRGGKPVMKRFWEITPEEAGACLEATRFSPASLGYFRGGGYSSEFESLGGMPVTMSRVNWVAGLGPVLQIAEGETVALDPGQSRALQDRTDPSWPTTWFTPRVTGAGAFRDVYSVMNNWGANHGAISYGHIGADLIALAAILRIPVSMHNVQAERIFRPKYWASFGDAETEGADYRACAALGPLYGGR